MESAVSVKWGLQETASDKQPGGTTVIASGPVTVTSINVPAKQEDKPENSKGNR